MAERFDALSSGIEVGLSTSSRANRVLPLVSYSLDEWIDRVDRNPRDGENPDTAFSRRQENQQREKDEEKRMRLSSLRGDPRLRQALQFLSQSFARVAQREENEETTLPHGDTRFGVVSQQGGLSSRSSHPWRTRNRSRTTSVSLPRKSIGVEVVEDRFASQRVEDGGDGFSDLTASRNRMLTETRIVVDIRPTCSSDELDDRRGDETSIDIRAQYLREHGISAGSMASQMDRRFRRRFSSMSLLERKSDLPKRLPKESSPTSSRAPSISSEHLELENSMSNFLLRRHYVQKQRKKRLRFLRRRFPFMLYDELFPLSAITLSQMHEMLFPRSLSLPHVLLIYRSVFNLPPLFRRPHAPLPSSTRTLDSSSLMHSKSLRISFQDDQIHENTNNREGWTSENHLVECTKVSADDGSIESLDIQMIRRNDASPKSNKELFMKDLGDVYSHNSQALVAIGQILLKQSLVSLTIPSIQTVSSGEIHEDEEFSTPYGTPDFQTTPYLVNPDLSSGGYSSSLMSFEQHSQSTPHSRQQPRRKRAFRVHLERLLRGDPETANLSVKSVAKRAGSVADPMMVSPKVLVLLCDYLVRHGIREPHFFRRSVDPIQVRIARAAIDRGDYRLPEQSLECAWVLLQDFLRELPEPLIPYSLFDEALRCVDQHVDLAKRDLERSSHFQQISQILEYASLDAIVDSVWTGGTSRPMFGSLVGVRADNIPLAELVTRYAFTVRFERHIIQEFFFQRLPSVHAQSLRYLGVLLARIALCENVTHYSLSDLANKFAPLIMRPCPWSLQSTDSDHGEDSIRENRRQWRAQSTRFTMLVLFYIKRWHHILTIEEKAELERSEHETILSLFRSYLPGLSATSLPPAIITPRNTLNPMVGNAFEGFDRLNGKANLSKTGRMVSLSMIWQRFRQPLISVEDGISALKSRDDRSDVVRRSFIANSIKSPKQRREMLISRASTSHRFRTFDKENAETSGRSHRTVSFAPLVENISTTFESTRHPAVGEDEPKDNHDSVDRTAEGDDAKKDASLSEDIDLTFHDPSMVEQNIFGMSMEIDSDHFQNDSDSLDLQVEDRDCCGDRMEQKRKHKESREEMTNLSSPEHEIRQSTHSSSTTQQHPDRQRKIRHLEIAPASSNRSELSKSASRDASFLLFGKSLDVAGSWLPSDASVCSPGRQDSCLEKKCREEKSPTLRSSILRSQPARRISRVLISQDELYHPFIRHSPSFQDWVETQNTYTFYGATEVLEALGLLVPLDLSQTLLSRRRSSTLRISSNRDTSLSDMNSEKSRSVSLFEKARRSSSTGDQAISERGERTHSTISVRAPGDGLLYLVVENVERRRFGEQEEARLWAGSLFHAVPFRRHRLWPLSKVRSSSSNLPSHMRLSQSSFTELDGDVSGKNPGDRAEFLDRRMGPESGRFRVARGDPREGFEFDTIYSDETISDIDSVSGSTIPASASENSSSQLSRQLDQSKIMSDDVRRLYVSGLIMGFPNAVLYEETAPEESSTNESLLPSSKTKSVSLTALASRSRSLHGPRGMLPDYEYNEELDLLNHEEVFLHRGDSCEGCTLRLNASKSILPSASNARNCSYCSRVLCGNCCSQKFYVPWQVIHHGSTSVSVLCEKCFTYLQRNFSVPGIDFSRIGRPALQKIGKIIVNEILELRSLVRRQGLFFTGRCPTREILFGMLPVRVISFVFSDYPLCSLQDLIELCSGMAAEEYAARIADLSTVEERQSAAMKQSSGSKSRPSEAAQFEYFEPDLNDSGYTNFSDSDSFVSHDSRTPSSRTIDRLGKHARVHDDGGVKIGHKPGKIGTSSLQKGSKMDSFPIKSIISSPRWKNGDDSPASLASLPGSHESWKNLSLLESLYRSFSLLDRHMRCCPFCRSRALYCCANSDCVCLSRHIGAGREGIEPFIDAETHFLHIQMLTEEELQVLTLDGSDLRGVRRCRHCKQFCHRECYLKNRRLCRRCVCVLSLEPYEYNTAGSFSHFRPRESSRRLFDTTD